jgi:pimeloyl-ACP methyl ester carboxylesterase
MQTKYFNYQSSKIFYRVAGTGKPVVLLHGFGEDGSIWDKQVDFLKDHCQLIIPDLPGSGNSELITDMSIEGMAELIKEIIFNELLSSDDQATVIGHSMGGYITLALAEKSPSLLNAFGLVHSSAFADDKAKKITRAKAIEFIEANGAFAFLKTAIPGLFSESWSADHNAEIDALVERSKLFTPAALIKYYQAMIARPERTVVLKNFPRAILFVIGVHDKAVPFEQSMRQTPLVNLGYIHILRNSAHMGMWEEPDTMNAAMLAFLQRAT